MVIEFKIKFTDSVPGFRCTKEMKKRLESIAQDKGVSLSEVQRAAVRVFFDALDTDSINIDTKSNIQEDQS